ncbi:DEAD/DEAH box helicase [Propionivibrio limicola]|uniref:DEAD/DEAH box helicase n=1 Tax=Propionivibrio limicola TaxID=167645 RepID=UPI001FE3085A|nr:DEAD/DEAH box helicase [Propionivibrio limicola]
MIGALSWLEELRRVSVAVSHKTSRPTAGRNQLFYFLHWSAEENAFGVTVRRGRDPENAEEWWALDRVFDKPPAYVTEEDLDILRLLWADRSHGVGLRAFGLSPQGGGAILLAMANSGRLCAASDLSPLLLAEKRSAELKWRPDARGHQQPFFSVVPEAGLVIPVQPPWYVDLDEGVIGALDVGGDPEALAVLEGWSEKPVLVPADMSTEAGRVETRLVPVVRLQTLEIHGHRGWRDYIDDESCVAFDVALPVFRYQDIEIVPGDERACFTLPDGEVVRVSRQTERERVLLEGLLVAGLEKIPADRLYTFGSPPASAYGLANESAWAAFMQNGVAALRSAGWEIQFDDDFRHHALDIDAWDAELFATNDGWFDLDMGIIVEGERLLLAPLLATLFRQDSRWLDSVELRRIPDDETIELRSAANKRIRASAGRLKPLALTLIDLFEGFDGRRMLRVSRFDAQRLNELNDTRRWQFRGQSDVLALAERLHAAQGIKDVEIPSGLGLDLRPYQREGVAWLQFLRAQGLAGILADDMGLGKTAQALAHLLIEKQSGRMDRPTLIILPTSLIFNWRNEAARFAPELKVLSLHGPERKNFYADIPQYDVVLTTYSLLWRDAEELLQHSYHLLILDEAQTVKNARSRGAEVIRKVDCRHRLCLTGTPLENHLGELWSQFDFLLPGFLGGKNSFTKYWRTPIEKQGDDERRGLLARRIRPFVLRRKKEEVALELPPKTVIIRKVELAGAQRDLYETVRAAMDVMVRDEIASKGFGRSQIVILDALLKLRQVCCDPRLVKSLAAQRVKERAKLDLLMTMVPEQVEEGRRILIFSQFTSMLALIEGELKRAGLDYVTLSGDTIDRETPVRRFQAGEVPIFLISLKAGGVGLNLTAADTVIHYDPWWNPAVENQATDRAHRLGQNKPVFVYKLIVAGSIEEKILSLQERKAALADGILSEERSTALKFGEDDIASLFEPLPL